MGSDCTLKMLFFPFMAQGHILPMMDMAKLFATRGVKSTFLTTPGNAATVEPLIGSQPIQLLLIPFPSDTGLPEGFENLSSSPKDFPNLMGTFFAAMPKLRDPFERILRDHRPDCVVTDVFFPWTYDVAAEFDIPRLVFHGVSFFSHCVTDSLARHRVLENLPEEDDADAESVVDIPGLPDGIRVLRSQMPPMDKSMGELFGRIRESELKSYGLLVNSFFELEPDYVRHYREIICRRGWHIGPLGLSDVTANDSSSLIRWLDSESPGSVVYLCFGSLLDFSAAQLREIALGLEDSGRPFVWVVKKGGDDEWVPEGFEARIEGRGVIVRGWAPQKMIVNHGSVGGFVTHCGWNSTLEGLSAGLPLVTWPLFAEQFYNERLIVDVLRIGVSVGVKKYCTKSEEREVVRAEMVKNAVDEVMGGGEEGGRRRERARELGEKARRAVEEGGSSYNDLNNLIQELREKKNGIPIGIRNGGGDV